MGDPNTKWIKSTGRIHRRAVGKFVIPTPVGGFWERRRGEKKARHTSIAQLAGRGGAGCKVYLGVSNGGKRNG